MRFNDNERRVIASAQLQAWAPVNTISRESGLKERAVRYTLDSLLKREILVPYAFVNPHRLGLSEFGLFFTISADSQRSRRRMLQLLVSSKQIPWVAEVSGDYQYAISFVGTNIADLKEFISGISDKAGVHITKRALVTRIEWGNFPGKYLAPKVKSAVDHLTIGGKVRAEKLDDTDFKILSEINICKDLNITTLAKALGTPPSTLRYRLDNLERRSVIAGYGYRLNVAPYGMHVFRILVFENGVSSVFGDQLFDFCRKHPNVVSFVRCFGHWDYEIRTEFFDATEFPVFVDELFGKFGSSINSIKTLVQLNMLKVGGRAVET